MTMEKAFGRLKVRDTGWGYHSAVQVSCVMGHNDQCPTETFNLSMEEARDLHYALGRLIDAAKQP